MAHKFKAGDKVKVIKHTQISYHSDIGITGIIYDFKPTLKCFDYYVMREDGVGESFAEGDLQLCKKDWSSLQVGDIIVDTDGREAKILAVLGDVFLISVWNQFELATGWFTSKEAQKLGWKIQGTEDVDTVKMTVSEVSKLVGKKVEIIEE